MAGGFKNSISNKFNRMLLYSMITAFITGIFGLILLFMPDLTNKVVGILVGFVFLVSGVNAIYKYFHRDGAKLYSLNILFGILYSILGVVIIVYPFSVMTFVTICLGLYLVVSGAVKMNYAFWLKRGNEDSWLITLVSGIMLLLFGILVMFNPFISLTLTQLAGAFLLIVSILDFTDTMMFKKRANEIMNIFW
ncbi:MAG: DUF308 domain-containing protein [Bacilli bacterium]|nr:DUF308 domain-containing protein [Bacilli bacterium]